MPDARAGVVLMGEVNGPMPVAGGSKLFDWQSPATWALIWFLLAVLLLFVL